MGRHRNRLPREVVNASSAEVLKVGWVVLSNLISCVAFLLLKVLIAKDF